jgi:putative ABC transport system substrate-binding protein
MRRREFIAMLGGSAVWWPMRAGAHTNKTVPKVGFLGLKPASSFAEYQWADTVDQLPALAARLVSMNVDLIFAPVSVFVEPARQATKSIPIVFASHADPVGLGHVQSLAHPGSNITGLSMLLTEMAAKELEILHETIPGAKQIAVLWNPTTPSHTRALQSTTAAAVALGIEAFPIPTRQVSDFDAAVAAIVDAGMNCFLVLASPITYPDVGMHLIRLALRRRLAGMFGFKEDAEAGGLMSYSADILDLYRRSAVYIDKILKGAKPSDLPVEQASVYELVINLKTANALGITIPPSIMVRADEVIE